MRDARGTRVQIEILIEGRLLRLPCFLAHLPAPHREGAATDARPRLEDLVVVAKLAELVCCGQTCNTSTEDDDSRPGVGTLTGAVHAGAGAPAIPRAVMAE